jgi:hypothetical protein
MTQVRYINLKIPIFSWLFFLFLSSGISYNHNNLQFGKPVQIERVDQLNSNYNKRRVAQFSVATKKSNLYHSLNSQYFLLNLLSERLQNYLHIAINRQTCLFHLLLKNSILHFRSHNLHSNFSDDFSDFNY